MSAWRWVGGGSVGVLLSEDGCLSKLIKLYTNSNRCLVTPKLHLNKLVGYFLLLFCFSLVWFGFSSLKQGLTADPICFEFIM